MAAVNRKRVNRATLWLQATRCQVNAMISISTTVISSRNMMNGPWIWLIRILFYVYQSHSNLISLTDPGHTFSENCIDNWRSNGELHEEGQVGRQIPAFRQRGYQLGCRQASMDIKLSHVIHYKFDQENTFIPIMWTSTQQWCSAMLKIQIRRPKYIHILVAFLPLTLRCL